MSQTIFLDWNDDRVGTWDGNDFEWQFVAIVIADITTSIGGAPQPGDKKKRKLKIKLVAIVGNEQVTQTKEINNIPNIFIQDIKFIQTKDIKLEVKL